MESQLEQSPRILFVDDEAPILKALSRFGRSKQWQVQCAESGNEALELLSNEEFDIVISDMRMPEMNGAEFLAQVKNDYPKTIRILLTGYSDIKALEQAINSAGIFNYLSKPWDGFLLSEIVEQAYKYIEVERERSRLEELTRTQNKKLASLARLLDKKSRERAIEIQQALALLDDVNGRTTKKFVDSLNIFNQILDRKNGRNAGHNRFVSDYSDLIARKAGLSKLEIENIAIAAPLHRVGALALPESIREKPQYKFSKEEMLVFQEVPVLGGLAISKAPGLQEAGKIIRHQNEWINGNGYPDGLLMQKIPQASQIIFIVSSFYDVFSGRVIENVKGVDGAIKYIKEWTGKKFDTALVKVFLEVIEQFDEGDYSGILKRVDELTPGMVLDESIVSKTGTLLLTESTELTLDNIKILSDYELKFKEKFTVSVRPDCQNKGEE